MGISNEPISLKSEISFCTTFFTVLHSAKVTKATLAECKTLVELASGFKIDLQQDTGLAWKSPKPLW